MISMSILPTEIVSQILRNATFVPEALDTSPAIFFEDRIRIKQHLGDSMRTKTSLSRVSKSFHAIMELYLFETIIISRFEQVPVLLRCLRTVALNSTISRGHRCKRLDIYLGSENIFYSDEVWYEGGHSFWGLIPACPNLKILVARVIRTPYFPPVYPHLTHIALWKTIATHYSSTLRRLELYGVGLREGLDSKAKTLQTRKERSREM